MLDPKYVRNHLEQVTILLKKKHIELNSQYFYQLESRRKSLQSHTENLQNQRKAGSKEFGKIKAQGGDVSDLKNKMDQLSQQVKQAENELHELQHELEAWFLELPNLPDESVPQGKDDCENVEVRKWGSPKQFDFTIQDHVDLGSKLGLDFETGAKLAGSRFNVMQGKVARLHRALAQFMLDVQTQEHGYQEVNTPILVQDSILTGTGQLPKFESDLFKVNTLNHEKKMYLIPTAEVTLTNMVRDQIIPQSELPIKLTAHSLCFRSEAGSYGRDIRGLIRQHQFEKIELVQIVHPDESFKVLESMLTDAETILQKLELPYRVVNLCGGDLGFSATKTYDIEVWLPGQACYREISSVSNCLDFQARRMKARFRNTQNSKPELVHTLNGSGLAVGRTLIAVLENYQNQDGSITVPEVIRSYMGGCELLAPNN